MGYIKFDNDQLVNLEYSLTKEMVRSNRAGSYTCSTILGCNTRKYHGLLICPQPDLNHQHFVLLSKVDETVIQRNTEFNIGVNRFPGTYNPKGHKYVREFNADVIPKVTYSVGGVILTKETLFVSQKEMVMIRYTLVQAKSPTRLRIRPFMAFRNIHSLSKQNLNARTQYREIPGGIATGLYDKVSELNMQFSKKDVEYFHIPDWYQNFEYYQERDRGFPFHEDLYTSGYFEFDIAMGESVIFSASTSEVLYAGISRIFANELNRRIPRNTFENCLLNSAQQFVITHRNKTELIAGYPWYSRQGRFTFISVAGFCHQPIILNDCRAVIKNMIEEMQGPCFPEWGYGEEANFDSADTGLWFFWAIQNIMNAGDSPEKIWKNYGSVIKYILDAYRDGAIKGVSMHSNGMLYISEEYASITWMNAQVNGKAATPRYGFVSEVNALWYNALKFALQLSHSSNKQFYESWLPIAKKVQEHYGQVFWNPARQCLYDFVSESFANAQVRPNQLLAVSLPYSPLGEQQQKHIVDRVAQELLTPRGLRSLSPNDMRYKGRYTGNEYERNLAFHQGTVWPWLLGHFAEAYLKIYGTFGLDTIEALYHGFEETMLEEGVGTICEVYEGDPPHQGGGAVSFAASVSELLRTKYIIDKYVENRQKI